MGRFRGVDGMGLGGEDGVRWGVRNVKRGTKGS